MDETRRYIWRGPPLNLKAPTIPEGSDPVTHVKAGAEVTIVSATEESALVAFPPTCPFLFALPRALWEHVHDETEPGAAASEGLGGWDGETLSPELLLQMLQHPNAVAVVTALVEQRGPEAKAAVMPLLNPLMVALVPKEHLGMAQMLMSQYAK